MSTNPSTAAPDVFPLPVLGRWYFNEVLGRVGQCIAVREDGWICLRLAATGFEHWTQDRIALTPTAKPRPLGEHHPRALAWFESIKGIKSARRSEPFEEPKRKGRKEPKRNEACEPGTGKFQRQLLLFKP